VFEREQGDIDAVMVFFVRGIIMCMINYVGVDHFPQTLSTIDT